ncbi:hypothetical protein ACI495_004432 [Vibrio vulnificus]
MPHSIDLYLKTITNPNASALENALARVKHLETLLGQSDIEAALMADNAAMAAEVESLSKQKREINELISRLHDLEQQNQRQKDELQKLGAELVKKIV